MGNKKNSARKETPEQRAKYGEIQKKQGTQRQAAIERAEENEARRLDMLELEEERQRKEAARVERERVAGEFGKVALLVFDMLDAIHRENKYGRYAIRPENLEVCPPCPTRSLTLPRIGRRGPEPKKQAECLYCLLTLDGYELYDHILKHARVIENV